MMSKRNGYNTSECVKSSAVACDVAEVKVERSTSTYNNRWQTVSQSRFKKLDVLLIR